MKVELTIIKSVLFLFLIVQIPLNSSAERVRAMWVTAWSLKNPKQIDQIISDAQKYEFNQIFVQVRYRGDALYTPNKYSKNFLNPEAKSYVLIESGGFDPLQYFIDKTKGSKIEIHAWATIFVASTRDLTKLAKDHLYFKHSDWITYLKNGKPMSNEMNEGAFLDAGIAEVQKYILNILSDIVQNYEISGLQLDYIRYPDTLSGFNPIAIKQYKKSNLTFSEWKVEQINQFVQNAYKQLKAINPNLQVSAAVIAEPNKAINQYSQDWPSWLQNKYIDKVYLMAYNSSNKSFHHLVDKVDNLKVDNSKIVFGLRAWKETTEYPAFRINEKLSILRKHGYKDFAFYSYMGMVENHYFEKIRF